MTTNYSRFLRYSVICFILAGCSSQPGDTADNQLISNQLEQLLADSRSSDPLIAVPASLSAAELLAAEQPNTARQLLSGISVANLSNPLKSRYMLVDNQLLFNDGDYDAVIENLSQQTDSSLLQAADSKTRLAILELLANSYALQGDHLASANVRISLSKEFVDAEERQLNNDAIWRALTQIPNDELPGATSDSSELSGWVALTQIAQSTSGDISEQVLLLNQWRNTWGEHPAANNLPGGLGMLEEIERNRPKHIALLLPLSGKLAKAGESLRDGFLAAHYQSQQAIRNEFKAVVRVYDSSQSDIDIQALYNQAVNNGAELVIGPLQKSTVNNLAESENLTTPVLALNYSSNQPVSDNFYQLSISTHDEIALITEQAKLGGAERVLLTYPETSWGQRIADEYSQVWSALDGEIVATAPYTDERSMSPSLKNSLNINISEQRARTIARIVSDSFEADARRRQDIDAVFVVAQSQQARSIRPLLAFYYAQDLPVYASSHIYSGRINPSADKDLNTIYFSELPWMLTSSPLNQAVRDYIGKGGNYSKSLYALGIDAYATSSRLPQLKGQSSSRIYGSTGTLKMDEHNKITRRPAWATFKNGRAVPLPTIDKH
ncbi:Penicillin-binding protein activator LpoA [Sinobacterium norvegicum]|uniref:Penicillin-binding protein activator LpoA n=1 Tax=Sinobacterium norvegicum TaxID=1641715 RepID=A0ABM9AIU8_9GAMM|nr:penicillin-binding protein activator [Sinobacterium norvegicum]CAH0993154.1 Penicillin-binding protein activator LpoA [Sinobacterium norvegicum]